MSTPVERCGLVAIVGRANVGKSTLLNCILGQKLSITSRKPQTTRYQILGVKTIDDTQLVFVDTPGWQRHPKNELNRQMNRQVRHALGDVDRAVLVADARYWHADDQVVYDMLSEAGLPIVLALNKHDLLKSKADLLPLIAELSANKQFAAIIPICARTGSGVDDLVNELSRAMPERAHLYPHDQITDRPERFFASEIIREKTLRFLGDELPYRTTVLIDDFKDEDNLTSILATIWVERDSQKSIVIGKDGELLKRISTEARQDLEQLLQRRVFLRVWVKTRRGWTDSAEAMQPLGLGD
ncbi:MAG: GTPase Era [Proteobacteria bacterium]|jgi:GTP-binding protein Era|nr:GTPase Era [Pseudomonadota bacterium]MBK8957483.1 GTPase Era [Pseudomonadota bacterium]